MNTVIFGASKGLGFSILSNLSKLNTNEAIVVCGLNPPEEFTEAKFIEIDLSEPLNCNGIRKKIEEAHVPKIDNLIYNSGVGYHCPVEDVIFEELINTFNVNVISLILVIKELIPLMSNPSKVILISSILGSSSLKHTGTYTASKHAMNGFGKVLREELRAKNISVTIVEPGAMSTRFIERTTNSTVKKKFGDRKLQKLDVDDITPYIVNVLLGNSNTCPEIIRISPIQQNLL